MKPEPTQESVAHRIRTLRKSRGWSLSDVETRSRGSITAVALGSYERCDRALSLRRLIDIAKFFDVPLTHLINDGKKSSIPSEYSSLVIDLRRMKSLSEKESTRRDHTLVTLAALVTSIAHIREDWNAEVMSLRRSDLSILALMSLKTEEDMKKWLSQMKLVFTAPGHP